MDQSVLFGFIGLGVICAILVYAAVAKKPVAKRGKTIIKEQDATTIQPAEDDTGRRG